MKKLILFTVCLIYLSVKSQIDTNLLFNDWYLVKLEMRDGSKPFKKPKYYYDKIYSIKKDYLFTRTIKDFYDNKENFKIPYSFNKNFIITNKEYYLEIESLTKDSLILSQNIPKKDNKDLEKYFFVPIKTLINRELTKNKNSDTLYVSKILTPTLKNGFFYRTIKDVKSPKDYSKNPVDNFRFNGVIIVDNLNRNIKTIINDYNPNFQNEISKKVQIINTYKNWNLNNFEKYKYIKIPFAFIHYYEKKSDLESFGDLFNLNSTNYDDIFIEEEVGLKQIQKSNEYFNIAVNMYQKQDYIKAIENFQKCYTENYKMLDAYYNYAMLNFNFADKEEACKIWKFLKDEGQKDAESLYSQKCIIN